LAHPDSFYEGLIRMLERRSDNANLMECRTNPAMRKVVELCQESFIEEGFNARLLPKVKALKRLAFFNKADNVNPFGLRGSRRKATRGP